MIPNDSHFLSSGFSAYPIMNTGNSVKHLSVYSYIEFCLWNAVDDCNNFQRNFSTGEVEVQPEINIGTAAMSEYITRQNTVSGVTIMLFMPSALLPTVSIQAEKVSSVHTEVLQCLKLLKKVHLIILLQADGHLLDLSESILTLRSESPKNLFPVNSLFVSGWRKLRAINSFISRAC